MRHLIFHHVRIEPVEEVYAVGSAGQSVGNHGEADSLLLLRSNPSDGHIVHSCVTFYTVFADTSEGIFHKVVVHPVVRYQNIGILFGKPRLRINTYCLAVVEGIGDTQSYQNRTSTLFPRFFGNGTEICHESVHNFYLFGGDVFSPCHRFEKTGITGEVKLYTVGIVIFAKFPETLRYTLADFRFAIVHCAPRSGRRTDSYGACHVFRVLAFKIRKDHRKLTVGGDNIMDVIHTQRYKKFQFVFPGIGLGYFQRVGSELMQFSHRVHSVFFRWLNNVSGFGTVGLVAKRTAQWAVDVCSDTFGSHVHTPVYSGMSPFNGHGCIVPVPQVAAVIVPEIPGTVQEFSSLGFPLIGVKHAGKQGTDR